MNLEQQDPTQVNAIVTEQDDVCLSASADGPVIAYVPSLLRTIATEDRVLAGNQVWISCSEANCFGYHGQRNSAVEIVTDVQNWQPEYWTQGSSIG